MSEQLLQQILNEIKGMKSEQQSMQQDMKLVKSQLKENIDLTRAIRNRQEETDAKLESLTMDVHKLHGEASSHQKEFNKISEKIKDYDADIRLLKRYITS